MRALFLFTLLMLLQIPVSAAAEQLIIEANDAGQVIVDENQSLDGNEYILNEAEPQEEYAVQMLSATTFAANNYKSGFFDNYKNLILSNNLPALGTDNKIGPNGVKLNQDYTVILSRDLSVTGFYYNADGLTNATFAVNFYDAADNLILSSTVTKSAAIAQYRTLKLNKVKKIVIKKSALYSSKNRGLYEFDFFIDPMSVYSSVLDFEIANIKHNSATAKWTNPIDSDFLNNDIYLNDEIAKESLTTQNFTFPNLTDETEYKVTIRSNYSDGKYVDVNTTFKTLVDTSSQKDVSNLQVIQDSDSAVLTWDNPSNASFESLRIYRSGILIADDFAGDTYTDNDIVKNINYRYTVIAVNKHSSASVGVSVRFIMAGEDVYNVKAKATAADVVDITWSNPMHNELETVKIYRKKKPTGIATFAALFNSPDYQPLFQTNGTTFIDLTVAADTAYTYKLATVIAATETDGIEVDVKTPPVKIAGDTVTKIEDNGQTFYLIKWTSPSVGKIQVLVGGVQYAIVNAADKQIKIPAADMLYTKLGMPDVSLVPLDDNETPVGLPSQPNGGFGDISLSDVGLDATTIMLVAMLLISLVMSIILLALAFRVTPKIIELIFAAFK